VVESYVISGGFRGNGAYEGTTVMKIKGEKLSEAMSVKFNDAVLTWAAGGTDQTTITRVDKGVVWVVEQKKRLYTEMPIGRLKPEDLSRQKEVAKAEKSGMKVVKSEFKVKKTGMRETINSFSCEEYRMTWLLELEDSRTKARTKNIMTTEIWTTPETGTIKKIRADQAAFAKAYMKRAGMDMSHDEMRRYGMDVLSMASGASVKDMEKEFTVFRKELSKIKGYPIRTVISWMMGGDAAQAQKNKGSSGDDEALALAGGLGGMISGLVGQKVKESVSADQNSPFFSSTVEVRSLSADALPASVFEIPEGFDKKAEKD